MQRMRKYIGSREAIIAVLIMAIAVGISAVNPTFAAWSNIQDILMNVSYITIAALGMTIIIITGGIDTSSGACLALLSLVCGQLAKSGLPVIAYFVITVLIGMVLSALSGVIIVKLNVPSMICTLCLYNIFRGGILVVTGGKWITGLPDTFNVIGKGTTFGVPNSIVIMIIVLIVVVLFLVRTELGRNIYAVGSNASAARLAGINVNRTIIAAWAISGMLLGIASIVYCTRYTTIQTNVGENLHLTLIAASVIGGTNILGGSGKPMGTFFGALLLTIIRTALLFLKVSTYWDQAVQGALILVAILIGMLHIHRRTGKGGVKI